MLLLGVCQQILRDKRPKQHQQQEVRNLRVLEGLRKKKKKHWVYLQVNFIKVKT